MSNESHIPFMESVIGFFHETSFKKKTKHKIGTEQIRNLSTFF
jgi:hypothetical protein